jgi:cell shape-determining protein MreC
MPVKKKVTSRRSSLGPARHSAATKEQESASLPTQLEYRQRIVELEAENRNLKQLLDEADEHIEQTVSFIEEHFPEGTVH